MEIVFLAEPAEVGRFGSFVVRWYGVFYVVGFYVVYWLGRRWQGLRDLKLSTDDWLLMMTAGVVGTVLGGRLGYAILYEPGYFWVNLGAVWQLWRGGMAFHGALLGVGLGLWWVARRLKVSFLALADVVVAPVALALALGRVGNWLNGELFAGHWALGASAALVGVAGVYFWALRRSKRIGLPAAVFLLAYSGQRFVLEMARIDGFGGFWGLTRGQVLSLGVGAGVVVWLLVDRRRVIDRSSLQF